MKSFAYLLALGVLLPLAACSDGGGLVSPPKAPVATIQVSARAPSIATGDTMRVFAIALSAAGDTLAGKRFVWTSDNEAVATVNQAGVVTTRGPGAVVITATAEQKSGSVPLTVLPPPPPPGIGVAPASVSFAATQGQGSPPAKTVSVTNTGGGTVAGLSVSVAYPAGQPAGWLAASLDRTTLPATLTLQANPANLQPGTYNATATIRSTQSGVTEKSVNVTLAVSPALPPAPTAPGGLGANASGTQVALNWTDNSTNEADFRIERKTGASGTPSQIATVGANTTSYTDSGLAGGTSYVYRVRACNAGGCSAYSNEALATTPQPVQAPSASTSAASGITATGATLNGSVNPNGAATTTFFEWGASTNLGNTTAQQSVGSGREAQSVSAGLTGLSPNTTYYFRVVATNSAGTTRGTVQSFTTAQVPPAAPSNLTASGSRDQIVLAWRDNSNNESEFRIERKEGAGGSWAQIATVGPNIGTYADANARRGTNYFYRVRACNNAGCSAYSNEANDRL